ncbi:thioredoxin family protein [Wenyingzhuangia sp. chi5]|uniref:Thioredoxin family protein n=1 Tax=Wenyingzhuangia gilva TaxID=3057677 RepID=A0ABT8VP01_9FLAO|nr:thioredoxin family protein [Wenyingzhuangia sp. chi5]MDO3693691.1 thioredoxin family protein [Wenyingzhuangia sp. chi5]
MALTPSNMMKVGTFAPDFMLPDTVSGVQIPLEAIQGEIGTLVLFICNHCPYVIHINKLLVKLANQYQPQGINFIAISSNDVENYPQDSPELMKKHAIENKYPFPYLYDETQEVAKEYNAACTPDIYLFDANLKLYYHGQLDGSRPGNNIPPSGEDIKTAFEDLLNNKRYTLRGTPSVGCGIKWKK